MDFVFSVHCVLKKVYHPTTKNYWNQTTTVKIIIGGWMTYILKIRV